MLLYLAVFGCMFAVFGCMWLYVAEFGCIWLHLAPKYAFAASEGSELP
jgi:hypothetical protein